jgi:collagen type III alpha
MEPEPSGGKGGPPTGLIIGLVLAGATLLVLGALSIPLLLQNLSGSSSDDSTYSVGDCVVQEGDIAQPADCGQPGAFEIVSEVNTREECNDPTQPAIEVAGPPAKFYCLTPAAAAPATPTAPASPESTE